MAEDQLMKLGALKPQSQVKELENRYNRLSIRYIELQDALQEIDCIVGDDTVHELVHKALNGGGNE